MIDLSFVIVNFNSKEYLIPCLASIFETGNAEKWEVILIDNGSQDGSGVEVRRCFPKVRIIENHSNSGFAKAVNQGLRISSGRYVVLLNPDTRVREEALDGLLSFMDSHPDAGIAGVQLLNADGSRQNSIANFPSLATELLNKSLLRLFFPKKFPGKEKYYSQPLEVDSVIGACMMVRRDAMERVGVLDEDYFLFLEETDWCYRMKRAGWKIFHVPQAQIVHFQGKSAEKHRNKAKLEYYRSRYHFFKKHRGSTEFYLLLTGLVIKLVAVFLVEGVMSLLTFFRINKLRKNLSKSIYLLWWHLRFCPEGMGLKL